MYLCVFLYKFIRMLFVIMFISSFIIKIHFQCLHNSSISVVYLALLNMIVLFTGIQPCQTVSLLLILQLYFFILSTRICTEYCSFPFGPCSTDCILHSSLVGLEPVFYCSLALGRFKIYTTVNVASSKLYVYIIVMVSLLSNFNGIIYTFFAVFIDIGSTFM